MNRLPDKRVLFVIHPTQYDDYDVLAIGHLVDLEELSKCEKHFHLVESSRFGTPILILDCCDGLEDAKFCAESYRAVYGK